MAQTPTHLELRLQERANDPFWLVWASVSIRIKKQKQKNPEVGKLRLQSE